MNKTLINASAAREGGAQAIVEEYVRHHDSDGMQYILLSPIKPKQLPSNFIWKNVETEGVSTILFAFFFIFYYVKKFKVNKIISFSNVNLYFGDIDKITYFHNFLILTDSSFKYSLIRKFLSFFGKVDQCYIFQTKLVYYNFCKEIFTPSFYNIAWPGVRPLDGNVSKFDKAHDRNGKIQILVPIVDLDNKNKNIALLYCAIEKYGLYNVEFNLTAPKPNNLSCVFPNVNYIGQLSKEDYTEQLLLSNAVLVLSLYETVCLPIFEALSVGRLALVYEREYVKEFFNDFGEIKGLITFSDIEQLKIKLDSLGQECIQSYNINPRILEGNWDF